MRDRDNLLEDIGGMPLIPLTVQDLHEMIDAGIIPDGAPIELVDGVLVHKDRSAAGEGLLTHNPRHAAVIRRVAQCLATWCESNDLSLSAQLPVILNERSAPEPDIAIITGACEGYQDRHPGPAEIAAVIEVADSSLVYDRTTKQRLYGLAGIPTYWIVNLPDNQIEVYQRPDLAKGGYAERVDYRPDQSIPLRLGEHILKVDVAELVT